MKETTKVSIGGFAFDIDTDAYEVLDTYLNSLKSHFRNRPEGDEIIADVEARMSELFHLKLASSGKVATLKDAEEIITTMGNPRDFDEDGEEQDDSAEVKIEQEQSVSSRFKNKKLYRDVDHKVVAGVCSGLGHFFRIDPVLIRIGFILLLVLTNTISHKFNLIAVLIYIILYIAMPKAKTMSQKIAMLGQDPTIEGIENREEKVKRMRGEGLSSRFLAVLRISLGAFLTLLGVVFLSVAIVIIYVAYFDASENLLLSNVLPQFGFNLKEVGFASALCGFMPGFMLLYAGIRLFFKMQKSDIVILCVSFVIWLSSALYVGNIVQKEVLKYAKNVSVAENNDAIIVSDTLQLQLDSTFTDYTELADGLNWHRMDNSKEWFGAPAVIVLTDTTQTGFRVSIEKKAYARSISKARKAAEQSKLDYNIVGSSILISPQLYSVDNIWDRKFYKIIIKAPVGKVVKAEAPIKVYYAIDEVDVSQLGNPSLGKSFEINLE